MKSASRRAEKPTLLASANPQIAEGGGDGTGPLNVLSFDVSERDRGGATVIVPRVDGVMLTALAEQFECDHQLTDPAGGYGGLIPELFEYGPLDRYFLGKSETTPFVRRPGRIFLLGCECGEVICWPLMCSVEARDRKIAWRSFEQPYQLARDYSSFGPFVFELEQYEEALRNLPK